jgi:hypothetical protein
MGPQMDPVPPGYLYRAPTIQVVSQERLLLITEIHLACNFSSKDKFFRRNFHPVFLTTTAIQYLKQASSEKHEIATYLYQNVFGLWDYGRGAEEI